MSLKIHGIGASRASRPLWAALELGLQFEHSPIHYQGGATRKPDFLALNPNGHIPVLEDVRADGTVTVWESMACNVSQTLPMRPNKDCGFLAVCLKATLLGSRKQVLAIYLPTDLRWPICAWPVCWCGLKLQTC